MERYIPLCNLILGSLLLLAMFTLIGLSIAALLKYLRTPPKSDGG